MPAPRAVKETPKVEVTDGTVPQAFLDQMEEDGWHRHAQDIEPWETGKVFDGTFLDIVDGNLTNENGTKAKLLHVTDTQGKEHVLSCPTTLASKLARAESGKRIKIICTGKYKTQTNRQAWGFEVFTR